MRIVATMTLLLLAVAPCASAQTDQCTALPDFDNARQTCHAAVDFARAYYPLAGLAVSGGNPVLAHGGTAGRLGAVTVTLRANAFQLHVPDLNSVSAGGTVAQRSSLLGPAPLVEAQVGLFPGLRNGLLSVDLLAAAQLVPNEDFADGIRVDSGAAKIGPVSLGLGFGARVGLMSEAEGRPAMAVSVMRRSIPRVGYGDVTADDQIQADADLVAWNVRGTIGKQLGLLMLAGGAGWSRYSGTAHAAYDVGPASGQQGTLSLDLTQSRWMTFVDAGLHLGVFRLTAEIGYQFGVDQHLDTTFEGYDDTTGTVFYAAGLQFGI